MSIAAKSSELRPQMIDLGSQTDADLLEAWTADGHAAALATIIDRYSVMVLSVCRRRCRSEADADDAFQTTFLYLAHNSKKIRHPERLGGWLHRVAQRAAVATFKTKQHETKPMVDTPVNPEDPLDRLTQRHEAIVLDEELADLPEHYRAALVMHIYDGQPLAKLADHFGTTVGSIRGRLQRGKQLLGRRLRRRGVVPVLAFAAASAWTVPKATAAEASGALIDLTADGQLPEPPIETSLLDSLLNQGANVMSSLYTTSGVVAATAMLAFFLTATPGDGGEKTKSGTTVTISAAENGTTIAPQFAAPGLVPNNSNEKVTPNNQQIANAGSGGMAVPQTGTTWVTKPVIPEPTSAVAKAASEAFDKEFDFGIATSFAELPEHLEETTDVPVLIDDRAIAFAQIDPSVEVILVEEQVPLRTALRRMLRPLGLKAVVEDEGIVITADMNVLVHRGIGISRWINIDNDAEKRTSEILDGKITQQFMEMPLSEVLHQLADGYDLPIKVDERALDDVGMTTDIPVTGRAQDIKLRSALALLLDPLDLTYTVQGESLLITTLEANDSRILNRIYWLEGTGFAEGDYQSIIDMITSTIEPDMWDMVGGPSTISELTFNRPALMIGTTYTVHQSIQQLLDALRESHFGTDPVLESMEVPSRESTGIGGGFGGGGFF